MINRIKSFVLARKILTAVVVIIFIGVFLLVRSRSVSNTPTYQTAQATKGTLINSVTASGTIVATNNIDVTSSSNGQVAKVYVKEGDVVTKGQKLFEITLDATGELRQSQAYASYISAKNQVSQANASYYTLQAGEFAANQKFINDAVTRNLATNDPTYIEENATWLAAEANFNNNENSIAAARANLASNAITYQQSSSTIVAPASGTIQNITVVPGMAITNSTSSSSSQTSATTVANIETPGNPVATVNIAEIDVTKVKAGQKVTLTFDSIPNVTFTGKIAGINKLGTVSSGVTNYPATIEFDSGGDKILPNMAVSASIITNVKDGVIKVPSSAVQNQNGQTVVRELKNDQLTFVDVVTGDVSDTETEIVSGVNESDEVITSVSLPTTNSSTGTSPFGGTRGFGGGGGAVFINRGRGN